MKGTQTILFIVILIAFNSQLSASTKNLRCKEKMEEAKSIAYNIGLTHYISTGDVDSSKKKGANYLKKVCRSFCRGINPRFGGRQITCKEQISSDTELDAILNKVNFEADISEDNKHYSIDI